MNSNKTIILATITTLILSIIVSITGAVPGLSLFLGNGLVLDIARVSMLILLITLLIIKVPRPVMLRVVLGASSVILLVGSIYMLGAYELQLLDGLIFITIASVMGFEALEFDPETQALGDVVGA